MNPTPVSSPPPHADLFVDPACPWAWLTSRWLDEVVRVRDVVVTTRLFSLAEANRSPDGGSLHPSHEAGERALRVLAAVRRAGGPAALAAAYTILGEAHHERGRALTDRETLEECVAGAGLDPAMAVAALEDPSTLDEVIADHRAAVALGAFGVPSLSLDGGPAFFGPIVDVRIRGEDAGELWDLIAGLLRHSHVFELKRDRGAIRPQIGRLTTADHAAGPASAPASGGGDQLGSGTSG